MLLMQSSWEDMQSMERLIRNQNFIINGQVKDLQYTHQNYDDFEAAGK